MKTRVFAVCVVVFLFCGTTHAGLSDGLVAYYPFNGNANDESGNGNNGTVHGATLTTDRFGNANKAYYFNGVNSFIEVSDSSTLDIPINLTFSVWINQNVSGGFRIIDKITATGADGYLFDTYSESGHRMRLIAAAGRWALASTDYTLNSYHHLAVTLFNGQVNF